MAYDLERTCGARVTYFSGVNYTVKVVPLTYLTRAAFHGRVLTRVLYDSAVGRLLHQFLHRLRRPEFFRSLIYRNTEFVE